MTDRLRAIVTPVEHALRVTWVVLALCLYIAGAVLVGVGCNSLWSTLRNVLSIGLWNTLRNIFIAILVLIGVFDLVCAIILAMLQPLECCRLVPYHGLKSRVAGARKRGNITSALLTGSILIVISVIVLLFAFGITITVARKLVARGCREVVNQAVGLVGTNNYCLDLKQFGLNRSCDHSLPPPLAGREHDVHADRYCLNDVATFCNKWETLRVNYIVLGAVLMLWAHTLFLLLVARNFALTREYRLKNGEATISSHSGLPKAGAAFTPAAAGCALNSEATS